MRRGQNKNFKASNTLAYCTIFFRTLSIERKSNFISLKKSGAKNRFNFFNFLKLFFFFIRHFLIFEGRSKLGRVLDSSCGAACNAITCNTMPCNAMPRNATQCHQCYAMSCNAIQCNTMQCNAIQFHTIQCHAIQWNVMPCSANQCLPTPCNTS